MQLELSDPGKMIRNSPHVRANNVDISMFADGGTVKQGMAITMLLASFSSTGK